MQEAGVVWEVLATEGPGHAQQILTTLDLASWGGVVVVSGDGLVHEVYNGLLARADWSEALGFPVGVIPGGSGNALVRSVWRGPVGEHSLVIVVGKLKLFHLLLLFGKSSL